MEQTKTPPAEKKKTGWREWNPNSTFNITYFAVLGGLVVLYGIIKYLVIPKCRQ